MIAMRTAKRYLFHTAVCAAFVLAMNAPVASAETLAPWWGLTSQARPTSLQPGAGQNAVVELSVTATGGEFLVVEPRTFGTRVFAWDAPASVVQDGLRGLYSSSEVDVSGGPEGGELKPYVITFPAQKLGGPPPGVRPNVEVQPPEATGQPSFFVPGTEDLQGPNAEVVVSEVEQGEFGGNVTVLAENLGDDSTQGSGTPVSIVDKLPPGLEAVGIFGSTGNSVYSDRGPVECSLKALTCTFSGTLPPYEVIEVQIYVVVRQVASPGERNEATVSGGGAAMPKTESQALDIGGSKHFGLEDYKLVPENVGGSVDTQAGSHPFQLTSIVTIDHESGAEGTQPTALPRDIVAELPAGLVGDPTVLSQCTDLEFEERSEVGARNECPAQSAIGVANVTFRIPGLAPLESNAVPIFNMTPLRGEPARFGFEAEGIVPVFLDTTVRTGGDYGVTVTANNITEVAGFVASKLTFWGVPGDPRHDGQRGWACVEQIGQQCSSHTDAGTSGGTDTPPFLIMPTSCERPFESTGNAHSWPAGPQPSYQASPVLYSLPEALDGCNHLPFSPSITVTPDVASASTASGLTVGVHVSQTAALNPEGLAESTLRDTRVTLPAGVALNPAGADGLEACSESQIGFLPGEGSGEDLRFTPASPSCPDASKIGTVKIETPLLPNPLEGEVYLATQHDNPFGSLIAMYIVAEDPVSGVLVKLPGEVVPDPVTGQLVSTFKNTPQLPFEELELHFFGGARAPLSTPALCGSYETNALFGPWSGEASVNTSSAFQITTGPNGGPCTNPLPFAPSLTAGTTSIQAGGFSPFTMTMSRPDGSQNLQAIQLKMPPGLLGTLATVKLCKEAQANAGTCGPETLIGHTVVSVGVGGDPYSVTGGEVFITEGYEGAPYGLSIVNPAKAGPFDLGKVIVRAKIEVDPLTAALTITTDNSGPYKIPTILDGIPLQIQHVEVSVDRPDFTFNPTNCSPLQVGGSLYSSEGSSAAVKVPFQITNCAVLAFKPKLTAKTAGKTSRKAGASLSVKLTYPAGPYDANIARVKVDLPKQLPSRLTTLQKACPAATFEANPAACPSASIVGH